MILDVISNEASHKNYIFLKNVHEKIVFQICNHGYKNAACLYLSNGAG